MRPLRLAMLIERKENLMVDRQPEAREKHMSSTGMVLTEVAWLDTHFEACYPEYKMMLYSTGMTAGWHVLDAGCGGGNYLPLLADLLGPTGRIAALDLAPENIAVVKKRLAAWNLSCSVSAEVGTLIVLPYPDSYFDAVWSANVMQYFGDVELPTVLKELCRVVRPGGLVALKDVDMHLMRLYPADPFLVTHLCEASIRGSNVMAQSQGSLRGQELRRWLEKAGLEQVWQKTTLIERWAPLQPVERQLFSVGLTYLAQVAEERGVPETDLVTWRSLCDATSPENLVNHPDFYACEGQVVAVGRVAETVSG